MATTSTRDRRGLRVHRSRSPAFIAEMLLRCGDRRHARRVTYQTDELVASSSFWFDRNRAAASETGWSYAAPADGVSKSVDFSGGCLVYWSFAPDAKGE